MPNFDLISGGGIGFSVDRQGVTQTESIYSINDVTYGGAVNYGNRKSPLPNTNNAVFNAAIILDNLDRNAGALGAIGNANNPAQMARMAGASLNNMSKIVDPIQDITSTGSEGRQGNNYVTQTAWGYPTGPVDFNVGGPGAPNQFGNVIHGGSSVRSGGIQSGGSFGNSSSGGYGGTSAYGGGMASAGGISSMQTRSAQDWKVKVTCPGLKGIQIVFPITPNIQTTDTAKYSAAALTHSNYAMQFYECSEVSAINISAEFPVQNEEEGMEVLMAVSFCRAATKMFWGRQALAGTPPPLIFLDGYGGYFTHVPCVLTSFTHTQPEDKDYIAVGSDRVATLNTLQMTLQPVYSRDQLMSFSSEDIAEGKKLGFI